MAEIFKNPELIITPSVNAPSAGGKEHTGNSEIDAYINSLPEDEREDALLAITAPKTGEELHNEMLGNDQAKSGIDPSKEDWLKINQFYRTRDTDYLKGISESAGHIYDIFGHAMASVAKDPSLENLGTVTPSVFEGAVQNLRGLYGIAAESVDSTSPQAKFFNILNGRTEDSDESYRVFLEARKFGRESQELAEGTKSILFDKHHLNNDFVQAAALVADPTMFIPFGKAFTLAGGMLGMSERSMALAARTANIKNKILGGAIKYGAGMPIEFIGKGTRVTLDHAIATGEKAFVAATGVSSETFREGMRMSGVGSLGAGYFGHSVPLLTTASGAYVAGTAAAGVGEALSVIGHQMMKGERGIASYARQALKDSAKQGVELSGHSKALLKIIDGFDPLIDYTTTVAQGAAHGSVIGAGLGYWSGGEEGLAQGIGAGIALGSVGGTAGRLLADVTGRTYKHRTSIQAKLVIEGLRDLHPEQAQSWERAQAWARARNFSIDGIIASKDTLHPNTHIEVLTRQEYARYLAENGLNPNTYDGKTFLKDGDQPLSLKSFEQQNGYVVENRANGTVKIYLNADARPRATLGHELFHSILRNSVMKDYYAQAVKEKVIGTRNAEGNLTNRGVVDIREVKEMFRRYLDAEFKDPTERADAQARLEMAEKAYKDGGQMVADPALGGRPLLEHLSEEFGAYYFSHLVMDKPIDWLYHGGDLPGIRGVLDNAKSLYQNYWRSRMNLSAPEFDFSRTFIDANGVEKLVPIDEVFAPATRDMFGNITGNAKRVVNPAMDLFFRDMLRIEKKVNETGQFDITKMDKQTQQRYIDSEGLDGVFTKDQFGNYQHSTEAQIKRENRVKGKAVYQLLLAIPEAERTFVIDADGNIRGHLTPQMLDNIVNSGHMTRAMANKISLFQSIARGEAAGNIVDFGGIGGTAERPMDVNNPSRMYGGRVPYKSRTAVVFGIDTVIGKDGKFQFKGNMLDYKVIETRANNEWSNAEVRSLWNGNHTEYLADFYRYLENASKAHDDATRVPSAELWTDGKGAERRNVLHQVLGMAKGEADTFLNSPKAEINRNAYSTVMSFSLNRMTNLRLRSQSVPFKFENAYRDLVRNWSPAEMDSEITPRGKIFKHPSGFRFVQREDGKTDAFDEQNKRIGTYQTAAEATEAGRKYALKHPSTVLLKDNMTDNTVINRSPMEGEGEVPLISRSEAAEARRIGDLFNTDEMQKFVGDRKLVRQTADEGFTDFIKKFREGEINQETALMMLDEMSKDMFGGLDRQAKRIRLQELNEKALIAFEKDRPLHKGMYNVDFGLPDKNLKQHLSLSEYIEARRLEEELAKPAPQKQLHSEFTGERSKDFAKKILEAYRWVKKANPQYNDFSGYLADNVPMREYYQHAVYSKQFKTGEPVVVVGVHGTYTSKGFLKDRKYKHDLRVKDLPLSDGERRGAYFASSDETVLNPEYQGYDPKRLGYEISPDFRRPESDSPNIGKSAIRFNNPLVVDGQQTPMMKRTEKILGEAIEKGHDGVIYINQTDGGNLDVTFILPIETANKQQRMIGSTRDKAKAGASYEPLPRGEGVTNRTVNLSPKEGAGELPSPPMEYPIYEDSLQGFQQYALPWNSEPFPMRDIMDFTPVPVTQFVNPKVHSLWQLLEQSTRTNTKLKLNDVLTFIQEQGKSIHPNVRRGYISQWAEALKLFTSGGKNPDIVIESGLAKDKGWKHKVSQNVVQFNKTHERRPKKAGANNAASPEGGKGGENEGKRTDSFSTENQIADADEVLRVSPIKSSETTLHLNLEELVDRMYGTSNFKETSFSKDGGQLTATVEVSARERVKNTLVGHSFEGTALEEIAHALVGDAMEHPRGSDPALAILLDRVDGKTNVEASAWKTGVDNIIDTYENRVKNGLYVDPINLSFVRLLKLQRMITQTIQVTNGKSTTSLWDSKGIVFNQNKEGKNAGYNYLKEGYTLVDFKGTPLFHDLGEGAINQIYRFGNTHEFIVSLFNDPRAMAMMAHIEVNPELLQNLYNKRDVIKASKGQDILLPREERLAEELSGAASIYLSENNVPKHSVVNQIIEDVVSVLALNRRMHQSDVIVTGNSVSRKPRTNVDIPKNTVSRRYHLGIQEPVARPKGVTTPYEKWWIQKHRDGLAEIANETGTKSPLEGLSDWEAWQELKKPKYQNPQYKPFIPYKNKNAPDFVEAEGQGVRVEGKFQTTKTKKLKDGTTVTENVGEPIDLMVRDGGIYYEGVQKRIFKSKESPKQRVGRWDEKKQKWVKIGDEESISFEPVKPVVSPDKVENEPSANQEPSVDVKPDEVTIETPPIQPEPVDTNLPPNPVNPPIQPPKPNQPKPVQPTPTQPTQPIPPAPIPKRDFTQADIRVWRSWKTETYGNSSALKNALGYVIMSLNKNYRVYNPQRVLLGIYKDEEDAKRRVQREEPKR